MKLDKAHNMVNTGSLWRFVYLPQLYNNRQLNLMKWSILETSLSRAAPDGLNISKTVIHKQFTICDVRSGDSEAAEAYSEELNKIIENRVTFLRKYIIVTKRGWLRNAIRKKVLRNQMIIQTLGFKQCKNRLTALLCCNALGTHLQRVGNSQA